VKTIKTVVANVAYDWRSCRLADYDILVELQVVSLPNCQLKYLASYVAYVYVEDSNGHGDGTLAPPVNLIIGPSNSFVAEPVLMQDPTTSDIILKFTPEKIGRTWVLATPLASLVATPPRSYLKAGVGAVGASSCFISGASITASDQVISLTNCKLDPTVIYAAYVYIEDPRGNTDGMMSRMVAVKVKSSNNFVYSPIVVGTPTLDGLDVEFTARSGLELGHGCRRSAGDERQGHSTAQILARCRWLQKAERTD
jgi:hypothetical protein